MRGSGHAGFCRAVERNEMRAESRTQSIRQRSRQHITGAQQHLDIALICMNNIEPTKQIFETAGGSDHTLNFIIFEHGQGALKIFPGEKSCSSAPQSVNEELKAERRRHRNVAVNPGAICEPISKYR